MRLKRNIILLLAVGIHIMLIAQPIGFSWVKQLKEQSAVWGFANDVELDANGNLYTCGRFSQTLDFDPGPGVYTLTTNGVVPFVAKYDPNGALLWARMFDGLSNSSAFADCNSIVVDNSGNVYCGGGFNTVFDFDPSVNTYTLNAINGTGFICKLNSAGNFVWAGQIGRDSSGSVDDLCLSNSGHLLALGSFRNQSNDFDPSPALYTVSAVGNLDAYILTLSTNGVFNALQTIGSPSCSINRSNIFVDNNNNIYITGHFGGGVLDFDPGPGTYTLSAQSGRAYLLKLNSAGNFVNVIPTSHITNGSSYAIDGSVDAQGNTYCVYFFINTCDFDPGPGTTTFTASGAWDLAVCKFTSNGNLAWAKHINGAGIERAYKLIVNPSGEVFITFNYDATTDVDPGPGSYTLSPQSGPCTDACIVKLDNTGNFSWAKVISGTWHKHIIDFELDVNGNIFAVGSAQQGADFDPGPGPSCTSTISALYSDPFILKLSPCSAPFAPVVNPSVVTSCGSASFALNASSTNSLTWRTQLMSNTYIDSVAAINTGMLAPGNYTYYAAAWNCCAESFPPAQVNVSVFPIPTISLVASKDTFCLGEPVVLTAQGGVSYVMGTTFSSGNFTVWPSQNTTYTVNGGDINNCVNTASIQLIYDPCTAITEQWLEQAVAVWPNPTADMVQLAITRNGVYTVEVYDNLGRLLFTKKIDLKDATPVTFNFNHQGVYQLVITSEAGKVVKKVVVE